VVAMERDEQGREQRDARRFRKETDLQRGCHQSPLWKNKQQDWKSGSLTHTSAAVSEFQQSASTLS